ncbi:hypothetical protein V9T40_007671 [Parthenolecanium corni]|uniref:Uncharacterized protein n=1 Tax=Parthenolecanium corni TaxID=536013 RepID=A0AAN9TXY2_9HEMI
MKTTKRTTQHGSEGADDDEHELTNDDNDKRRRKIKTFKIQNNIILSHWSSMAHEKRHLVAEVAKLPPGAEPHRNVRNAAVWPLPPPDVARDTKISKKKLDAPWKVTLQSCS